MCVKHYLNAVFIEELQKSFRQSMRGYWVSHKLANLHDIRFHATSLLKLQGGWQGSLNSQVGAKFQNRRHGWKNCGQPVNVTTSSKTGSTSIGQKESASISNLMPIGPRSLMNSSPLTDISKHQSSTKTSTNRVASCALSFDKLHRICDCPLTTEGQKRKLALVRSLKLRWPYREEAYQYNTNRQSISTGRHPANNKKTTGMPNARGATTIGMTNPTRKNWLGSEDRWNLYCTESRHNPKHGFRGLSSKRNWYSQVSWSRCKRSNSFPPLTTHR